MSKLKSIELAPKQAVYDVTREQMEEALRAIPRYSFTTAHTGKVFEYVKFAHLTDALKSVTSCHVKKADNSNYAAYRYSQRAHFEILRTSPMGVLKLVWTTSITVSPKLESTTPYVFYCDLHLDNPTTYCHFSKPDSLDKVFDETDRVLGWIAFEKAINDALASGLKDTHTLFERQAPTEYDILFTIEGQRRIGVKCMNGYARAALQLMNDCQLFKGEPLIAPHQWNGIHHVLSVSKRLPALLEKILSYDVRFAMMKETASTLDMMLRGYSVRLSNLNIKIV